ncbi:MAG: bifunctional demethylmenaquinone methyltransferase/2-methoxy-6-polyprenyl-1,4-benzoquinol methylase UbiE [Bacteroidota bacterium]|nr:bifunctional demethylmenaquinone methyltransferase/2-methoxy-6-polyprenyl-1,4-benzoquinol methylase UbiE [Bacteroidota bacterium]
MAKYAHDTIVPFKESDQSKKQQVTEMFDNIAFRYDFLNRFLSVGIDVDWRKKAIKQLQSVQPQTVLDVATGTADVAILTHKLLHPNKITGIDISEGMLDIGRQKIKKLGLTSEIELLKGDSETIAFADNTFDAITVAFGVRNYQNLEKGLSEMLRVLKPGGKLVVLEFSRPKQFLFKGVYNFYMNTIAPRFGKLIAKNKDAYQYLNDSVQRFPEGQQFIAILKHVGYTPTYSKPLTLGICTIYCGSKK